MKKLVLENLLTTLRSAEGVKMWQYLYVEGENGNKRDITNAGENSCALFVSSVLAPFGLIDQSHATVKTTIVELENAGWVEISQPKKGAIIVYPEKENHPHIGFILSETEAISNSSEKKYPVIHEHTMNDGRKPIKYFWNEKLSD